MAVVDVGALAELLLVAPIAGLLVATAFALVVLGATRSAEARREGNGAVAGGYVALAATSGLVFVAAVVTGILFIAQ